MHTGTALLRVADFVRALYKNIKESRKTDKSTGTERDGTTAIAAVKTLIAPS
ncbi:MAG: hypothetical protein AAFY78_06190 [Cyanobacteria bacterium J06648_16]